MKRITASLLLTIFLTVTSVIAQTNSPARTNGDSKPNSTATLSLPNKEGAVKFLVIGNTGTGTDQQQELARIMLRYHQAFPFEFVLMLGDNMYGRDRKSVV